MNRQNKLHDDWSSSNIIGNGNYQFIGADSGKTKMKHPIGFVRPKVKQTKNAARKKKAAK